MTESIRVTLVDDDPDFLDLAGTSLQRHGEGIATDTFESAERALERLDGDVDCVVSDYRMPGMDGLALLREVRADYPDLPFVLLTGKGSEEIASDAISAGVTDYMSKGTVADDLTVLGETVDEVVTEHRARVALQESHRDVTQIVERIEDGFFALDEEWRFTYLNDEAADMLGRPKHELLHENHWEVLDGEASPAFRDQYETAMADQRPVHFEESYPPGEGWIEVRVFPSEEGMSVYWRDITDRKRHEETLTALHRATRDMVQAKTREDIAETAAETAADILGFRAVAVYLLEESDGMLRPAGTTASTRELFGELPTFGGGRSLAWETFVEGEPRVYDDVTAQSNVYDEATDIGSEMLLPLGDHGVFIAGSTARDAFDEAEVEFAHVLAANLEVALDRADRERLLRERERELADQNERLELLNHINEVVRDINRALVAASNREEIEETVCEQLTAAKQYRFAWIGEHDLVDGTITPRAWAGEGEGYLDAVEPATDDERPLAPAARAVRADEVHVVESVLDDESFDPWRKDALTRGFKSVVAIPLSYRETIYGVLCVYADQPHGFSDTERTVLAELGSIIGYALNAVGRKQALATDSVAELEFGVTDSRLFLVRLSEQAGCTVELEGIGPNSGRGLQLYVTAEGADPDDLLAVAEESTTVRRARAINDYEEGCLLEVVLGESSISEMLADYGLALRAMEASGGEGTLTVELPSDADVRSVVDIFQSRYPDSEMVARRETSRPDRTIQEFESTVDERLTDRQREVLQLAYYSGFFEWPRDSNGQDLANALGVTQPTFHHHLRAGEGKVFGTLFDE